jgi:Xaa-Pro dipeptidase
MSKRIGKSLVVNGVTLVTEAAWNAELDRKHEQLVDWLRSQRLAGVLLRRNENVAWLTGGAVAARMHALRNRRGRAAGYLRWQAVLPNHRE